jgi:hypothetical protein
MDYVTPSLFGETNKEGLSRTRQALFVVIVGGN